EHAANYVSDKHRNGLQHTRSFCGHLNEWFEYLCYLRSRGIIISTMTDVKRNKYIEYRPVSHPDVLSFTEWLHKIKASPQTENVLINRIRGFFDYIVRIDNIVMLNPIMELDAPKFRRPLKSYRTSLTVAWWFGLMEMMFNNPPQ